MAIIQKNMSQVPDEIPPLDADDYVFKIVKAEVETIPTDADYNAGQEQLVVQLQVNQEGHKNHGRMQFDRILINDEQGEVKLKRLIKSAGLVPGANFDTDDLVDKNVRASVSNRAGKGKNAGKMFANIKEYLF